MALETYNPSQKKSGFWKVMRERVRENKERKQSKVDVYKQTERTARDYAREQAYKKNKAYVEQQERKRRYDKSKTGKAFGFLGKGLKALSQKGGITRASYGKAVPVSPVYSGRRGYSQSNTIAGRGTGMRGRPRGTLDKRYANYGGVYGWRKYQAHQRALERLQATQRATINPRQQQVINQVEAQDRYNQSNPENRVIPDSSGRIPLRKIMDEIDFSANLFP